MRVECEQISMQERQHEKGQRTALACNEGRMWADGNTMMASSMSKSTASKRKTQFLKAIALITHSRTCVLRTLVCTYKIL
eukprot:1143236-Pelagomonas_calceolata.AAC.2